jgi:lysophospholipase L1-like esterase
MYARIVNAGVSGNFLADIIARMTTDVIRYRPRDVVVMAGINDNKFGADPGNFSQMQADLTTIYTAIRAAGERIIAVTLSPWGAGGVWTASRESNRQGLNAWIMGAAPVDARVNLDPILGDFTVPSRPILLQQYVNIPPDDGLHWNALGAKAVGQAIWQQAYGGVPLVKP